MKARARTSLRVSVFLIAISLTNCQDLLELPGDNADFGSLPFINPASNPNSGVNDDLRSFENGTETSSPKPNSVANSVINLLPFGVFKKKAKEGLTRVIRLLKREKQRVKTFMKSQKNRDFKGKIQILVKQGWNTAMIRFRQLKKDVNLAKNYNDFKWWDEEMRIVSRLIEDKRAEYRGLLNSI